ncbi:MAG: GNAT family N-acetyltransferase [Ilumatobacteraceae bacterium]
MELRRIEDEGELSALSEFAASLQVDPTTHCVYLGTAAAGIAAELAEATWQDVSAVAVAGDEIVGLLVGDVDPDMGRVWWLGPFVRADDWESVADALLAAGGEQLLAAVTEEEMAVDARFERCRHWAARHGYTEDEGSHILQLDGPVDAPPKMPVREIHDDDHPAVIRLHEELFPGTHTTGEQLVAGHDAKHRRLVVEADGAVAGYVAVEIQPDGSGYVDYLGVEPAHRRRGLGADLVRAGVVELLGLGADGVGLSVRAGSEGARDLYVSLGFDEERFVVPIRRGFSLA